jgi:hypothetical protein
MPYIRDLERKLIDAGAPPDNAGELNYLFTTACHNYWVHHGRNYQAFNDIIGALEGCKLELYRRKVAPYEDIKIAENGDV